jgi:anti-anti-sigma factor
MRHARTVIDLDDSHGDFGRRRRRDFAADVVPGDNEVVVAVRGEIDLATVDELWGVIEAALPAAPPLVIDLSETGFLGSSGLAVLMRAYRALGERPGAVVVRSPAPMALRVMQVTGLDRLVPIDRPPPMAAGAGRPGRRRSTADLG